MLLHAGTEFQMRILAIYQNVCGQFVELHAKINTFYSLCNCMRVLRHRLGED